MLSAEAAGDRRGRYRPRRRPGRDAAVPPCPVARAIPGGWKHPQRESAQGQRVAQREAPVWRDGNGGSLPQLACLAQSCNICRGGAHQMVRVTPLRRQPANARPVADGLRIDNMRKIAFLAAAIAGPPCRWLLLAGHQYPPKDRRQREGRRRANAKAAGEPSKALPRMPLPPSTRWATKRRNRCRSVADAPDGPRPKPRPTNRSRYAKREGAAEPRPFSYPVGIARRAPAPVIWRRRPRRSTGSALGPLPRGVAVAVVDRPRAGGDLGLAVALPPGGDVDRHCDRAPVGPGDDADVARSVVERAGHVRHAQRAGHLCGIRRCRAARSIAPMTSRLER